MFGFYANSIWIILIQILFAKSFSTKGAERSEPFVVTFFFMGGAERSAAQVTPLTKVPVGKLNLIKDTFRIVKFSLPTSVAH